MLGNGVVIHVPGFAGEEFGAGDAFLLGLVREHRAGDDVADGVRRRGGSCGNASSTTTRPCGSSLRPASAAPRPAVFGLRPTATRILSAGNSSGWPSRCAVSAALAVLRFHAGDLGAELELDALFLEQALGEAGNVLVKSRRDARQQFDDGDFRAEARPDRAELEADGARADDDELRRHFGEGDGLVAGDDELAVEFEERQFDGRGAGGDENIFCIQFLDAAVGAEHFDAAAAGGRGCRVPWTMATPRFSRSCFTPPREFVDDFGLALHERGDVGGNFADLDAVRRRRGWRGCGKARWSAGAPCSGCSRR